MSFMDWLKLKSNAQQQQQVEVPTPSPELVDMFNNMTDTDKVQIAALLAGAEVPSNTEQQQAQAQAQQTQAQQSSVPNNGAQQQGAEQSSGGDGANGQERNNQQSDGNQQSQSQAQPQIVFVGAATPPANTGMGEATLDNYQAGSIAPDKMKELIEKGTVQDFLKAYTWDDVHAGK